MLLTIRQRTDLPSSTGRRKNCTPYKITKSWDRIGREEKVFREEERWGFVAQAEVSP